MNAPMSNYETLLQSAQTSVGGLHLRVFDSLEAVRPIWTSLQNSGTSTVYQSYEWCLAWVNRLGSDLKLEYCVVVAENDFGEVEFLLPLQCRQSLGLRIVEFLTAPQAAYGFGLFSQSFIQNRAKFWFAEHLTDLTAILPAHDLLLLENLPDTIAGVSNPMLGALHFLSANQSYGLNLQQDYNALLAEKRSADSRRSMRKRDAKLEGAGKLQFELPLSEADRLQTLTTMFSQQEKRLAEIGVHNVFNAAEREFMTDLALISTSEGPLLRPYRLVLNGEVLAVMLGAYHKGTYWALISSLAEGSVRKHSPGDYALRAMIQSLCEDGTRYIDFSAGDSSYKLNWSDTDTPLHLILRANTLKGLSLACFLLVREKFKRFAKRTPVLNSFLFGLRKVLAGTTA